MRGRLLGALLTALLLPVTARATHIVTVQAGFDGNLMTLSDSDLSCTGTDPSYSCSLANGSLMGNSGGWTLSEAQLALDADPSVTAITAVTNNTTSTQTFVLMVTLPVDAAFGPPSLIRGSISGSLTDTSGDGSATLSAVTSDSVYSGLIDGATRRTLLDDPFSATVAAINGSTTIGPADFGIPTLESVPYATNSDIGITLRFQLSAGDSASFTSVFTVLPVPEPGTLLLLGGGLAALALRRRS